MSISASLVRFSLLVFVTTSISFFSSSAIAQAEPILGQVQMFAFNFCPRGWAKADGSILSISEHTALFSLLGTIYGGDGRTTFALPDLRGRDPIGMGQGQGLESYALGQKGGSEEVNLPSISVKEGKAGPSVYKDSGVGFNNIQPYIAMNYCIALEGIYPSRN